MWQMINLLVFTTTGCLNLVVQVVVFSIKDGGAGVAFSDKNQVPRMILYVSFSLLFSVLFTPRRRGAIIRWLGSLGPQGTEQQRAAAIAELSGSGDPATILAKSAALFRCIRADQVRASLDRS